MKNNVKSFLLISIIITSPALLFGQVEILPVALAQLARLTQGSSSLLTIEPDNAQLNESLFVEITGELTSFEQATEMTVWFSQGSSTIYAESYHPYNDTVMVAWFYIPVDAYLGIYDLNVNNEIDSEIKLFGR